MSAGGRGMAVLAALSGLALPEFLPELERLIPEPPPERPITHSREEARRRRQAERAAAKRGGR